MVAESLGRVVIHLDTTGFRNAFSSPAFQGAVAQVGIAAGWVALEKKVSIGYAVAAGMLASSVSFWDGYLDERFPDRW